MTSNDNQQYTTDNIFRSELSELKIEIRSGFEQVNNKFKETRTEIQAVRDIALVNSAKIDAHWEAASMWFSIIAILVAAVGILGTFIVAFREIYKTKILTEQKVQDMINVSISHAVNDAVNKALGNINVAGQ